MNLKLKELVRIMATAGKHELADIRMGVDWKTNGCQCSACKMVRNPKLASRKLSGLKPLKYPGVGVFIQ